MVPLVGHGLQTPRPNARTFRVPCTIVALAKGPPRWARVSRPRPPPDRRSAHRARVTPFAKAPFPASHVETSRVLLRGVQSVDIHTSSFPGQIVSTPPHFPPPHGSRRIGPASLHARSKAEPCHNRRAHLAPLDHLSLRLHAESSRSVRGRATCFFGRTTIPTRHFAYARPPKLVNRCDRTLLAAVGFVSPHHRPRSIMPVGFVSSRRLNRFLMPVGFVSSSRGIAIAQRSFVPAKSVAPGSANMRPPVIDEVHRGINFVVRVGFVSSLPPNFAIIVVGCAQSEWLPPLPTHAWIAPSLESASETRYKPARMAPAYAKTVFLARDRSGRPFVDRPARTVASARPTGSSRMHEGQAPVPRGPLRRLHAPRFSPPAA